MCDASFLGSWSTLLSAYVSRNCESLILSSEVCLNIFGLSVAEKISAQKRGCK